METKMSIWEILLIIGLAPIAWVVVPALLKIILILLIFVLIHLVDSALNLYKKIKGKFS